MKNNYLKGQVLSEKEMKEVKGGSWVIVKVVTPPYNPPREIICDICDSEITDFEPNGQENTYVAVCSNCGCRKDVKKEE